MNARAWTFAILLSVTFGIYYQAGGHGFINFDDPSYVTKNRNVATGFTVKNIAWAFTSVHASNWHPVTWLSHMLDVEFFGLDPKGHHLVNVAFHLLNTLLLCLLLFRTTKSHWKSSFVAALFALHPLHVESVAWISERKDVLSAFFFFITLNLYHSYAGRQSKWIYMLALATFSIGLMSKPMIVTLPFVLFLMDFWPLQRTNFETNKENRHLPDGDPHGNRSFIRLILEKIPFLALAIISCVITYHAQSGGRAVAKASLVPIRFRMVNALVSYVSYISKAIVPLNLSVIYPLPDTITISHGVAAGLLLVAISAATLRMGRRHPYLLVGWLWYLGMLVPVIGLVQVGRQSMADRYTYLPLTGLFIMAAWGIPSMAPAGRTRNRVLSILSALFLSICAVATWTQLGYWKDSVTLFRHAARAVPKNYVAYNLLGSTYSGSDMPDEAITSFSEALRMYPDDEEAVAGMGVALAKKGDFAGATPYFRKAVSLEPDSAEFHSNLGFALLRLGEDADGIRHLLEAARLEPSSPEKAEIHFHIGSSFASMGKIDQSIEHFEKAISLRPDFVEAHYDLGVAYAKEGRWDRAIASFSRALQLNPDLPEAARALEKANRLKGKRPPPR